MCANYIPVTQAERLLEYFGVQYGSDRPYADVFPSGLAPSIRLPPDGTAPEQTMRSVADGIFRFVPEFVSKLD